METPSIPRISPEKLHARMRGGEELMVLDVRTADALRREPHQIPGSRWVPLPAVSEKAATLPRTATIVTYCTCLDDASSARAALWLREEGLESIFVLRGGLQAWRQAGYATVPTVHSDEGPAAFPGPEASATLGHAHSFLPGLVESYLAQQRLPMRKEMAVLFVDMAGSTALLLDQSPEVVLERFQHFMRLVTEAALAHCGDVKDYEGDGALLYFESAAEATAAALAIRDRLAAEHAAGPAPLRARMSLNAGSVVIGVMGSPMRRCVALIGPSINLAARLLKQIPPGGIVATEALVERLREEAPELAERFQLFDACLTLRGFENECVKAFHLP